MFQQLQHGGGRRGAIGIHIADDIGEGGQLQSFDQRAAFANGRGKILKADGKKLLRHPLHDGHGVVAAAVHDHDDLIFALIVFPEILRVAAQHRFDARFFVISRDEEQQAWFGHPSELTNFGSKGNRARGLIAATAN